MLLLLFCLIHVWYLLLYLDGEMHEFPIDCHQFLEALFVFVLFLLCMPLWSEWGQNHCEKYGLVVRQITDMNHCPYVTLFCQDTCSNCTLQIFPIAESLEEKKRGKSKNEGFSRLHLFYFFDDQWLQIWSVFISLKEYIGRNHPFWTKILVDTW